MGLLNEYIEQRMSALELENELLRLILYCNTINDSYFFIYGSAFSKSTPDYVISIDDYFIIFDLLIDV